MGTAGTIARDGDVHDAWIDLLEGFVAKTFLLRRPGTEVLAEDVGLLDELVEDFSPFSGFQVESQALHPPIIGLKICTGEARHLSGSSRTVANTRYLNLDDLSPEVSHQHLGNRPCLSSRT